jgi:hydrogenase expression/formation protein HypD
MKYVDEYRDGGKARDIAAQIKAAVQPGKRYAIMDFCGGHTHSIARFGLEDLLPDSVRLIHGPGCPVCVLPIGRIDSAITLARMPGVILCSYGDMLRVPGVQRDSLLKAKADGAEVRMVYSTLDALKVARENPDKTVVFFAIGFETTTPPSALAVLQAQAEGLDNFALFCNHVMTPPAMSAILTSDDAVPLDGIIGPGHVSVITGSAVYEPFAERYGLPIVISGFEPLDLMQAILMIVRQVNAGDYRVENQYARALTAEGNPKARQVIDQVFERRDSFEWRGFGALPESALRMRPAFAQFDAEVRFDLPYRSVPDHKACACAEIVRGVKHPRDCKIFGTACTPDHPVGSCMVSSEGACAAHWAYGRFRESPPAA